MRLLLDATSVPADRGGVGRYVDELLPPLAQRVDLVVVCQQRDVAQVQALAPSATVVAAPAGIARRPVRLAWEQVGLPRLVRAHRADALLSPHYTLPLVAGVPVVVTLHDATFFSHPEHHSPVKSRFFRAWTRLAVRRAASFVVPSAATRDEVLRFAGGSADRFHVAYHGVDTDRFHPVPADERERVRRTLGIGDRQYVAFLGTLAPLKNVPALIRAWVRASAQLDEPPALVLAGGKGWDRGVDVAAAEVPDHLTLVRAGYLPFDDLAGYLSGAQVVAFPSLGEGFGLPVLEAMACGAAVLTTRELSLPEVGGDAVAYSGTDVDSIAQTLLDLVRDPARRAALSAAAEQRAAGFTWEAAADVHVAAVEQAIAARR